MGLINIPDRPKIFKPIGMPQIDWDDPINRGLVAHWGMFPYEFGGKVIHDLSGNGNTGIFQGTPVWGSGDNGAAIQTSDGNYILVPDSPSLNPTSAVTLIVHFKQTAENDFTNIVSKVTIADDAGYLIQSRGAGGVYMFFVHTGAFASASSNTDPTSDLNKWTTITGTYDGSDVKIYRNGIFENSTADTGAITVGGDGFSIGDSVDSGDNREDFEGQIGYGYVYNRALSASEIAELYRRPL